jgi:hypothetical protein
VRPIELVAPSDPHVRPVAAVGVRVDPSAAPHAACLVFDKSAQGTGRAYTMFAVHGSVAAGYHCDLVLNIGAGHGAQFIVQGIVLTDDSLLGMLLRTISLQAPPDRIGAASAPVSLTLR